MKPSVVRGHWKPIDSIVNHNWIGEPRAFRYVEVGDRSIYGDKGVDGSRSRKLGTFYPFTSFGSGWVFFLMKFMGVINETRSGSSLDLYSSWKGFWIENVDNVWREL